MSAVIKRLCVVSVVALLLPRGRVECSTYSSAVTPHSSYSYNGQPYALPSGREKTDNGATVEVPQDVMLLEPATPSNTNLVLAISSILFFLPVGILALILWTSSMRLHESGDYEKAKERGEMSRNASIVGILLGLCVVVAVLIHFLL